ncbi:MAG: nuclear transport factor 2 family protein [Hyphomicrobiales bacterium]
MPNNNYDISNSVRDTIYRATIALDGQEWHDWLALCSEDYYYIITSFSPEINKDMIYMEGDLKEMTSIIDLLPKHNTDHSPLRRHTSVYTVDVAEDGKSASAVSSFVVYQNMLDGNNSHIDSGESRLFLVGKYIDDFVIENDQVKFLKREVKLDNRRLDKGSHWPI